MFAFLFRDDQIAAWALGAIAAALLIRILLIGSRGKRYPPGPPTLPIIGNLHQMPQKNTHLQYQKWAEEYGPIFHLKQGSSDVVVLAKGDIIKRLVDKRSGNYADRPKLFMQDIWEQSRIIMRGYDDLWKVERKLYHQFLSVSKATRYLPYQDLETKKICVDLLEDPNRFAIHITRMTTSIATSMAYGFRVLDVDSPVMKELFKNTHGFFTMVHHSKLLDWYPQLRPLVYMMPTWIYPLAKKAKETYQREKAQFHRLFNDAKCSKRKDNSLPSFAIDIAKTQVAWTGTANGALLTDHAASYIAGIAMEGASDTTSNTLQGFIKGVLLFPEAQSLAHEELDRVIGNQRLPTNDDFENLPYIRGTVKESLRWMPTAIAGAIPHMAREPDEFDGYIIPKGATIVLAVWAANNDPDLFPEPRKFDPGRHKTKLTVWEAATASDIRDRDNWTFGAGRRICPGMHVVERTLFLAISRILWAFDITRSKNKNGQEIEIDRDEVTQSIAACPLPFKCTITPRSPERVAILKREWATMENMLDEDGNYPGNVL